MEYWKFEKTNFIKERLFNPLLRRFFEYGVSGLVRENIQNSLDAKLEDFDGPVIVKIKLDEMNTNDIPGKIEIEKRVASLKPYNQFTKEAIDEMKKHIGALNCKYISFEDENTRGLSGSNLQEIKSGKSPYVAYAYSKGFHHEIEDLEREKIRGGSHGVGKIASNATSDFNMMYFANCDEKNHQTLSGTIELMEHEVNEECYRATGYFSKEVDDVYVPYDNDFSSVFKKDTRGLKIIIPYARETFFDEKKIVQTVCDSFMIAILEKNLVVYVNDLVIDSDSIEAFIFNLTFFEQEYSEIRDEFAPLYFNTYKNLLTDQLYLYDNTDYYRFKFYFTFNTEITSGRTGIYRTIGMKIEDHKVRSNFTKPYNAILMPYSSKEDEFLKSLENESHTSLDYKHINSSDLQANAKKFINNLDQQISKIIDEKLNSDIPDSEILDTSDIIYEIENKFKKDLEKKVTEVNIGNKQNKNKSLVKVSDTKEPGESQVNHDGKTENEFKKTKKIKKRFGNQETKEYFKINGSEVKRVVYRGFENVEIDVSKVYIQGYKKCNIYFSIIDGMGAEYTNEVNLKSEYKKVYDLNNNTNLNFDDFGIINYHLNGPKIKMRLHLNENANLSLKYKYYLEV